MITNPDDNVIVRAALMGEMELDENTITLVTCWMNNIAKLLTTLAVRCNNDLNVS